MAGNNTLLIVGAVGVAGYFAYKSGMFGSLGASAPAPAALGAPAPVTYNMGSGNDIATYNGVQVTYDKSNNDLTYKTKVLTLLAGSPQQTVAKWDAIYYIAYGGTPLAITLPSTFQTSTLEDAGTYINQRFAGGLSGYYGGRHGMGAYQNWMYQQTGRVAPTY